MQDNLNDGNMLEDDLDCSDNSLPQLTVDHEDLGNGIFVIKSVGSIELANEQILRQYVAKLINDGHSNIIFDFVNVSYIDSSGLAAVLSTLRRVRERGGFLIIATKVNAVLKTFRLTGVDMLINIYPNMEEAKQASTSLHKAPKLP